MKYNLYKYFSENDVFSSALDKQSFKIGLTEGKLPLEKINIKTL